MCLFQINKSTTKKRTINGLTKRLDGRLDYDCSLALTASPAKVNKAEIEIKSQREAH